MLKAIGRLELSADPLAWDFLTIALSVIAADESCSRSDSADGWSRTIDLTVAVSNPKAWTKYLPKLEHALGFLSTDRWKLTLIDGGRDISRLPYDGEADRWFDSAWLTSGSTARLRAGQASVARAQLHCSSELLSARETLAIRLLGVVHAYSSGGTSRRSGSTKTLRWHGACRFVADGRVGQARPRGNIVCEWGLADVRNAYTALRAGAASFEYQ